MYKGLPSFLQHNLKVNLEGRVVRLLNDAITDIVGKDLNREQREKRGDR